MFYSEQLLSKTGPLARVWLASNVERKLSKSQILQSDINSSVDVIVDQGQAPMALRLSGQLMLGVVRIYGRKARYLLDDCNEALLRIRMTFKPTNSHDLPAHATTTIDLNIPEMLTIDDLFPTMDLGFALTQQPMADSEDRMIDLDEDWTSSLAPQQSTQSFLTPDEPLLQEDDLDLNLGEDVGMDDTTISAQVGRSEQTPRADDPSEGPAIFDDGDDLGLNLGDDEPMDDAPLMEDPLSELQQEQQEQPEQLDEVALPDDETQQLQAAVGQPRRETESPLSEAESEFIRAMDETMPEPDEIEVAIAQPQRSRRVKPLIADKETVLHNSEIKAHAADRSRILRPASFLPRDPVLLTLMNMQKNGDFVTNAMNDGVSRNWAPELHGLLSFEVVHRSGQLKRKRDSGIADLSEDEHSEKSPRLVFEDVPADDLVADDEGVVIGHDSPRLNAAEAEQVALEEPIFEEDDDGGVYGGDSGFDDTTMPLVHPADSGPVSVGTKRAVHLLRETFGGSETQTSPSSQSKKSVLLQDLVPEGTTSREDATKMFFEILVLATKDAIKVDQGDKQIGLPLRIRAKRGLWGQWAEATQAEGNGNGTVSTVV